jgi:hypothetical protein
VRALADGNYGRGKCPGRFFGQVRFTVADPVDGQEQFIARVLFQQLAFGTRRQCHGEEFLAFMHIEHEYMDVRVQGANFTGRFETPKPWHGNAQFGFHPL